MFTKWIQYKTEMNGSDQNPIQNFVANDNKNMGMADKKK